MRSFCLLLILAACGGDGVRHISDAPAGFADASNDAAPIAAMPVTVTVTFDGSGVAGLSAIFTNADGSPVATVLTDATGTASQTLGAGGYVTVVDPFPIEADVASSNLYTWAGVKPGDHLVLYESTEGATETDFTLVTPTVANATTYNATAVCVGGGGFGNGSSTTLAMQLFGCTTADIYVAAHDSSNALVATLFHPALTVTANQTVDLSTTDHFAAAVPATYSFTNLPSSGVQVDDDLVGSAGVINGFARFTDVSAGSASFSIAQPALPANDVAFVLTDFATTNNTHDVYAWSPTAPTSYTLDASTATLPDVTAVPVFDYATDTLTWTAGSGVARHRARGAELRQRSGGRVVVDRRAIRRWRAAVPVDRGNDAGDDRHHGHQRAGDRARARRLRRDSLVRARRARSGGLGPARKQRPGAVAVVCRRDERRTPRSCTPWHTHAG
jgi:hypothetical protein